MRDNKAILEAEVFEILADFEEHERRSILSLINHRMTIKYKTKVNFKTIYAILYRFTSEGLLTERIEAAPDHVVNETQRITMTSKFYTLDKSKYNARIEELERLRASVQLSP
jgi:hypothetical protein